MSQDRSGPPEGAGRTQQAFAEVLRASRPELAGLTAQGGPAWPERDWLMADWAAVLESGNEPRHVLFAAGPGFGKTVAATQYGLRAAAEGWLVAGAFFRHGYASLEDPLGVVEHLSNQLANLLPGFRDAREASRMESGAGNPLQVQIDGGISVVARQVSGTVVGAQITTASGRPVDRAWRCDIADPLAAVHRTGSLPRVLIVADALDETSPATRAMLADGLTLLPEPVRLLMTARPGTVLPIGDPGASATVARLQPDAAGPEPTSGEQAAAPRRQDAEMIAAWACQRLEAAGADHCWAQRLGTRIADTAERTFLVATYLTDDLVRRLSAGEPMPEAGDVDLPVGGLSGVYDAFLARTFGEDTARWRSLGRPVLASLSVARGTGLTVAMLGAATELDLTDVTDTLTDCAAFLVSEPAARGAVAWRIWHRSFAEHLHASATYPVRPWDWHLRLGTALLPVAQEIRASTILDGDHLHQYATANVVTHLADAMADPDGATSDRARAALAGLDTAGGWLEALVLLVGADAAAFQVERLAGVGPSGVPWRAVADAIRDQSHVMTAPQALADGFTLGQLSLGAARSRDTALTAALQQWSSVAPMLLAGWSTSVSAGDVVATQPGGITAMVATQLAGRPRCMIGGRDGWVRSWSSDTWQAAGAWRVPDQGPVTCLACSGDVGSGAPRAPGDSAGDLPGATYVLVAVGTPTATYGLRWAADGSVSVLWQSQDGPVTAALALSSDDADAAPGGGSADRRLLVTSHREVLRARDLATGDPAGSPPSLTLPVRALAEVIVHEGEGGPPRRAVLAGSLSNSGRSVIWDPGTDDTVGELQLGQPVACLAQATGVTPGVTPGPLAVGLHGGRVRVGNLTAVEGSVRFDTSADWDVGPTRKASSESVTAVAWTSGGPQPRLVVGDTAGRIHRLDPASMARDGAWTPGHPDAVVALVTPPGDGSVAVISAGVEGLVKAWDDADIDPAVWPDQILTLDIVPDPDAPTMLACAHVTGEVSLRRADTGQLVARSAVHDSPVWALAWAGGDIGLVSGDAAGLVVRSSWGPAGGLNAGPTWHAEEVARLSGRVSALSSGLLDGRTVVLASTLFSELVVLDSSGHRHDYPPFGGCR